MITLTSVEVVNFRSVTWARIEPDLDGGMTAVSGANGTGKSTVAATGLLWALYGITPDGVTVRGLRRQGTQPGDECRVTVEFIHDQQRIEVTRALKGRSDATVAFIKVDGVEVTNVSSKTATAWIIDRFGGLDADGFLAAFVVRQKELDSLVRATPKERKELIERLAGIERMSAAVQRARDEETDARRRLAVMQGSDEDVAQAQERLTDAETALQAAQDALTAAQKVEEAAVAHADAAAVAARAAEVARQARVDAEKELLAAQGAVAEVRARYQAAEATVTRLSDAAAATRTRPLADLEADLVQARDRVRELRAAGAARITAEQVLQAAQQAEAGERQRRDKAATALKTAQTAADAAETAAAVFADTVDDELEQALKVVRDREAHLADLTAEYRRLTAALAALENVTEPICPTCAQSLPDPAIVMAGLRTALDAAATQGKDARTALDTATAERDTLTRTARDRDEAHRGLNERHAALARARADMDDATAQWQDSVDRVQSAESALLDLLDADPDLLAGADARVEELVEAVRVAREHESTTEELRQAQADCETLAREVAARVRDRDQAQQRIQELPTVDEGAAEAAREAGSTAAAAAKAAAEARTAAEIAEHTRQGCVEALTAARRRLEQRERAVTALQDRTATREALEAFRADRLSRIAPELSEVTTDLVARMSNGAFTAVTLDEKFTPIVTDASGQQRPASWLSGGEESTVALALRVGIGEIVAGRQGGLLVLDEVLTAQDEDRRAAMMSAIRSLSRQVIMVNHVVEALDMADRGYVLGQDDSGATVLEFLSPIEQVNIDATFSETDLVVTGGVAGHE